MSSPNLKNICRCVVLITALPLLDGCAILAFTGLAVRGALEARPDRELDYEIEVQTTDDDKLLFIGSTECPHSVGHGGGAYSTKTRYSSLLQNGEHWILSGISCHNEITENGPRRYILYRAVNKNQGKAYYVIPGGSAQVTKISFDSSIHFSSDEPPSRFRRYDTGPYFYRKVFLNTTPPSVKGQAKPLVVYKEQLVCGKQNKEGLSLTKSDFYKQFGRIASVSAVEEGHLEYHSNLDAWTPTPGIDPAMPLDVAGRANRARRQSTDTDPDPFCVRFRFNDESYILPSNGEYGFLYLPAENALYRLSHVWHGDIRDRIKDNREWKPCIKAPGIGHWAAETMYIINRTGYQVQIARQNPDLSYSCRRGLPRF